MHNSQYQYGRDSFNYGMAFRQEENKEWQDGWLSAKAEREHSTAFFNQPASTDEWMRSFEELWHKV